MFRRSLIGRRALAARTFLAPTLRPVAAIPTVGIRRCWAGVSTLLAGSAQLRHQHSRHAPPSNRGARHSVEDADEEGDVDEEDGASQEAEARPSVTVAAKTPMNVVVYSFDNTEKKGLPTMQTFDAIENKLPDWLREGIHRMKFKDCTAIQAHTMPLVLEGHDIIGLAPTGSGKTIAFAVPSLAQLQPRRDGYPQILVICPVRELVQQTAKVFRSLVAPNGGIRVAEVYGGSPRGAQASALWSGCEILVATPGRLNDFLRSGDTDFRNLSFLVFDEADRLLDMGFAPQLDEIMSFVDSSRKRQTLMWSATWPQEVQRLANSYLSGERLMVKAGNAGEGLVVNENIQQHVHVVEGHRGRAEKLRDLYRKGHLDSQSKCIFFVKQKITCEETAYELGRTLSSLEKPVSASMVQPLHGGMSQERRDQVIRKFRQGEVRVLVATDVASRGLDFPDVSHVVNYDAPMEIDSYVHRIGRTGRAGRSGAAHTFLLADEPGKWVPDLVKYLKQSKQEVSSHVHSLAQHAQHAADHKRQKRFGGRRPPSRQFNNSRSGAAPGGFWME